MWKRVYQLSITIRQNLPSGTTILTIKKNLTSAQKKMMEEQKTIDYSIDVSQINRHFIEESKNKTPSELFIFFLNAILFHQEQSIQNQLKTQSLTQLLNLKTDLVNKNGKLRAILPSAQQV